MSIMNFAKTSLRNLFSKPVTRNYPYEPRTYQDRTRGHIQIHIEDCIFCGLCMRKCPADALTVVRNDKTWTINRFGCIQCGACVECCPKKCLSMAQTYTSPEAQKTAEVFKQPEKPDIAN
jgi:ech hydrogenase subunit F